MKHTYFVAIFSGVLVSQAYGMLPDQQVEEQSARATAQAAGIAKEEKAQVGAAQTDQDSDITVTFGPATDHYQFWDVTNPDLWRYEVNDQKINMRPAHSGDIPEAMAEMRQNLQDLLASYPESSYLHNQLIPHEADPFLHLAIFMGSEPHVKWILRHSKPLNALNIKGQTALEYARDIAQLTPLTGHGETMRVSQNIVTLIETKLKKNVVQCAKKVLKSTLTTAELKALYLVHDKSLDFQACMQDCAQAMLTLLGKSHSSIKPTPQEAQQPIRPSTLSAEKAEEKEDAQAAQLQQDARRAEAVPADKEIEEIEEDIDTDLILAQMHSARQRQQSNT